MNWLSREELVASCSTTIPGVLRPHSFQSVCCIRHLVASWSKRGEWPLGLTNDKGLIVIAVDALTYEFAEANLSSDRLFCLTSSFPSTSVVSWLSSVTGASPGDHRVAGPVALRPGVEGVYNVIRGNIARFGESGVVVAGVPPPPGMARPTLFDDLRDDGVEGVALIGDFLGICEGWIGELTHGAIRRNPPRTLDDIRLDPKAIAALAVAQVEAELAPDRRRCVWTYVNLDEHIHHHGYDLTLRDVLHGLQQAARRWADQGYTVLLYSDHGQIANSCVPADLAAFDALGSSRYCRLPPGGAGRVRWLYPHAAQEDRLVRCLTEALGEHAFVCHSDELPSIGLTDALGLPGAGSVIAMATGSRFPVPDPNYRFEHGSATADEMLVPLAFWGPQ
ncbi:alkaline phosphatase family protein [Paraburkholderia domus]|uniref:alkaline phosphatase family protein n=1 Tax=Paraburkholderia domus TaxID=2793075 RepID=UPI001B144C96|nr:alkaline phosphatase family protein [Paraburkholderia domus]CAE6851355.1 hypothetical protein R75483_07614 [Paraburkholderia domus]